MNKNLLILSVFVLFSLSFVLSAVEIFQEPYSINMTTDSELNKSLSAIKTELNVRSCYIDSNWQSKNCDYTYYCGAILPSTSNNIADALWKECIDASNVTLSPKIMIKNFVPPKGVLYYVTSFVTRVNYVFSDTQQKWNPTAFIPTNYINVHPIRSVCPSGQMLDFDASAGQYKCYLSKRMCLDTLQTGLCTNVYTLWALDKNEDGIVSDLERTTGASLCADRPIPNYPLGDGICDLTRDLECVDTCSKFEMDANGALVCTIQGANSLCDEWDMAAWFSCWDDILSPNSKICDNLDSSLCSTVYNPVCVAKNQGTIVGGQTYPNDCFAKAKGFTKCANGTVGIGCYVQDACEPPIVQCYNSADCPDPNVCIGGSSAGISSICLNYMCSYSGACGNLACVSNADCSNLNMPCVGVTATCQTGVCTIQGKCLVKPEPEKFNLWNLIQGIWSTFWNWIKSRF